MIIKFTINFNPAHQEELFITGSTRSLGENRPEKALKMSYEGNSIWSAHISFNNVKERTISYKYFVKEPGGNIYYEAGKSRSIAIGTSTSKVETFDQWTGNTTEAPFLTAPFSDVFYSFGAPGHSRTHRKEHELIIRAIVPNVPDHCHVRLCGDSALFGEWKPEKSIIMSRAEGLRWEAYMDASNYAQQRLEYKFIVVDTLNGNVVWENCDNRSITIPKIGRNNSVIVEHSQTALQMAKPHFAGVAVPVFSLRSTKSHGVGDFKDLRLLVDWAHRIGMSIIQLLPINDTTAHLSWKDSYPYNCISTLALHPLYINLDELGEMNDRALYKELKEEGSRLNSQQYLDYEAVWNSKMRYCRAMYEQESENAFAEPMYYTFAKENREWLLPYAVFSMLRDHFGSANFRHWGKLPEFQNFNCSVFSEKFIEKVSAPQSKYAKDVYFYVYLQYNLYKQMCATKRHAMSCGVAIKGDIPIGISRDSVEAWQYPDLFNFGQQAGAPPDFFSISGQNWGFPTYNWDKMAEDNYKWWKQRLTCFAKYFDAYRIDHILGFFRIWETPIEYQDGRMGHFYPSCPLTLQQIREMGVPSGADLERSKNYSGLDRLFIEDSYTKGLYHPMISGQNGAQFRDLPDHEKEAYNRLHHYYFFDRHDEMWYNNAMKKLQHLIAATNMLSCGEDLGMLSPSVTRCMKNLKIFSLELMIMPKQFGRDLGNPAEYPYLSVCTTSTHDSETMRMWLGAKRGSANGAECKAMLEENLAAPSMLAIFPLQDWISIDEAIRCEKAECERINDPSNPNHYWRYRMHLPLEELLNAGQMNTAIESMVRNSGR